MNETDEQRLVIKDKTFNDIAVNELGKQRARCICCVQFGRCKQDNCSSCSIHKKYVDLTSAMTEYDQLRLHNYIGRYYAIYSATPEVFMRPRSILLRAMLISSIFIFLIGLVIGTIAIFDSLPLNMPPASYRDVPQYLDKEIVKTRSYVANNVYDYDNDGVVNCVDYATIFCKYWNENMITTGYKCEIVRNKNPELNLHHLFVILKGKLLIEIEPWYTGPVYMMEGAWGSMYNRKYNIYGETNKWLNMKNN